MNNRIFLIAIMLQVLCSACVSGNKIQVQPLVETEQPFSEWIDQDFKTPPPGAIGFKEDSGTWTGWNMFWFASAVGGQVADVASTQSAINRGCKEGNPLFGEDPSAGTMAIVKAATIGAFYTITEVYLDGDPAQQDFRNWAYGLLSVLGFGAAGWNSAQDCD